MTQIKRVTHAIFRAVEEVNRQLPKKRRLEKSTETVLYGELDSLGLVNLIVETEQKVEEQFGMAITLTDEKIMSQIKTIGTLADYVSLLLEKK